MDWYFYNFDITNSLIQNPIEKFRQSSIAFRETSFLCLENFKFWRTVTTIEFNIFLCLENLKFWQAATTLDFNISTRFLHNNVYKSLFGIFCLFCLDLELFAKTTKYLVSTHSQKPSFFTFLLITQDLKKKSKIPNSLL